MLVLEPEIAVSVLLIEDDEVFRSRLARALREHGFEVTEASDVPRARAALENDLPELVLIDLRLPGGSGLDLVSEIHERDPTIGVVVLTGYGSIATALEAMRRGATNYVTKPADVAEILAAFDPGSAAPASAGEEGGNEVPSLARVEWEHINRVLTDCGGNVSEAARRLGLHRRSLQRKLSKYPVRR